MILCFTQRPANTVVPGTALCATPSMRKVPVPSKQNRISSWESCQCSRTYPPGAITCTPNEVWFERQLRGLTLTVL